MSQHAAGERVRLDAFGESPEDALARCVRLESMPFPTGAALAPTDVVVEVASAGVALIDAMMLSGQYHHKPPLPFTPGMEYAGIVRWTGSAVDPARLAVGDRVFNDYLLSGPRSAGAHASQGGWASYAVAPQDALHRVPAGLSMDQAANFLLNFETAHFALVVRGGLRAGEVLLVNGASGAAGLAAVQVGKLLGAIVIAAGRSDVKLAHARAAGADHVINVSPSVAGEAVRKFRDDVKERTGGRGADLVFDTVGGAVSAECLRSLAFGGVT
ncbi:zinc-binding dehydrogenase [Ramlibacter terrae]|uniref:Zinc-binding dehydrogenase n=1 Tax=Ramlibacter terrae TaxID=2732511 RepID=A0ABX6P5L3_9BURK|nr:zinc-binding dehydrogenase [Ramlibacter terrae]